MLATTAASSLPFFFTGLFFTVWSLPLFLCVFHNTAILLKADLFFMSCGHITQAQMKAC